MNNVYSLDGKIALVTGASGGLGGGICEVLAECGADIIINHLNQPDQSEQIKSKIECMGRRAWVIQADVSSPYDVKAMFQAISKSTPSLDILVNNAGISQSKDIFEIEIQDWDKVLNTNLTSCFLCSKFAIEMMQKNHLGRIVNISSVVAHRGAINGHIHYAASKSGILGFTKTLARTVAQFGITVNAITPGIIDTQLLQDTLGKETIQGLIKSVPLGHLGTPKDVGYATAFLCSQAARYLTGITLDVNGGLHFR